MKQQAEGHRISSVLPPTRSQSRVTQRVPKMHRLAPTYFLQSRGLRLSLGDRPPHCQTHTWTLWSALSTENQKKSPGCLHNFLPLFQEMTQISDFGRLLLIIFQVPVCFYLLTVYLEMEHRACLLVVDGCSGVIEPHVPDQVCS